MVEAMANQERWISKQSPPHESNKDTSKMDWLRPHMMRIDDFCASLNSGQTYVHIPKTMKRRYDTGEYLLPYRPSTDKKEHEYRHSIGESSHEYKRQIRSVSVIVSDKNRSLSASSSVPSPSSSVGDNEDNHQGEHNGERDNELKSAKYQYNPAPMAKKSKRQFIPPENKDQSYWERRKRNNEAAKKSREQRREKEIEVSRKCSQLEDENSGLRFTIVNLQKKNEQLENTMNIYKEILMKNNLL
ncbi:thyrotroph embryonic factor-like isoform X2 [Hydractinia symbiolongicarpus]|nr:thyrotroph embryonic factor-like isoform X2 [Hydractinia symbiolongicarpus]XP_057300317.1 thyrotroph embryonic factor-like isoform X2 [Hydractinia symbiolongicarpus]